MSAWGLNACWAWHATSACQAPPLAPGPMSNQAPGHLKTLPTGAKTAPSQRTESVRSASSAARHGQLA